MIENISYYILLNVSKKECNKIINMTHICLLTKSTLSHHLKCTITKQTTVVCSQ